MTRDVKVYNYFLCRWHSGYGYVSDAPNLINLSIEEFLGEIRSAEQADPVFTHTYNPASQTLLAAIRYISGVESTGRNLVFSHVVALECVADSPSNIEALEKSFTKIYGPNSAVFISHIMEKIATVDKEQGRSFLEELRISTSVIETQGPIVGVSRTLIPSPNNKPEGPPLPKKTEDDKNISNIVPAVFPSRLKKIIVVALISFFSGFLTHYWYVHNFQNQMNYQNVQRDILYIKKEVKKLTDIQRGLKTLAEGLHKGVSEEPVKIDPATNTSYSISKKDAHIRETPSGKVITTLHQGETVELKDTQGDWGHVVFQKNGQSSQGWIRRDLIVRDGLNQELH